MKGKAGVITALLIAVIVALSIANVREGSDDDAGTDFDTVTLRQTGGIAGEDRSVTVQSNGDTSAGKKMADDDRTELRRLIAKAEDIEIAATYVPEGLCCDQFHYQLTIGLGGKTIATETADGAAGPKVVEDIIGLLIVQLPTGG